VARLNILAMRILFIALSIAALPAAAQLVRGEYPETQRSVEQHLNALAGDDMGGRLPGTEQGARAAKYIQSQFEEAGLAGLFGGEFLQDVTIPEKGILPEAGNFLTIGETRFELRTDYWPHVLSDNREVAGNVTWMGYGTPGEIDKAKKGSIAVMIAEIPAKKAKKLGKLGSLNERIQRARAKGAKAIILLQPVQGSPKLDLLRRMRPIGMPVVSVYDASACSALKKAAKKSKLGTVGVQVVPQSITAPNVGAWVNRGAPETIVIGAHYDHVGWGAWGSRMPESEGQVHNGADDNASGTSAMLELARKLSNAPGFEHVNFAFLAFTGEESGLLGSRAFVARMPPEMGKVKAMVNLDMVGRLNRSDSLRVYGVHTAVEFREMLQSIPAEGFYWDLRSEIFARSDHAPFISAGIPAVFFFTGLHEDYHAPGDDIQKIDFEGLAEVVTKVEHFVSLLGQAGPISVQIPEDEH
jgi:aminopeptidase YwaD